MRLAFIVVVLATISCGGKQQGGGPTIASGSGAGPGSASGGGGGGSAQAEPPKPVTKDECAALIGHIFDVGVSEKMKTWKPEERPSDETLKTGRMQQIERGADACVKMAVPRPMFDCAMNALDAAALGKCQEQFGTPGAGGASGASGSGR
jgi:hypothetical protein